MRIAVQNVLLQREIGVVLIIIATAIMIEWLSGFFILLPSLRNLFGAAPAIGSVATGVALLMITGEFDSSVGAVFAFVPMSTVVMMQAGVPVTLALVVAQLLCVCLGLASAFITLRLNIPSFIATWGTMFIIRSLVILSSGGMPDDRPWVGDGPN